MSHFQPNEAIEIINNDVVMYILLILLKKFSSCMFLTS